MRHKYRLFVIIDFNCLNVNVAIGANAEISRRQIGRPDEFPSSRIPYGELFRTIGRSPVPRQKKVLHPIRRECEFHFAGVSVRDSTIRLQPQTNRL